MVGQRPLDGGEGVVQGIHEQAAHGVDHHDPASVGRVEDVDPAARRALGVIQGPEQARIAIDVVDDVALGPDMVARGDDVDSDLVEFLADTLGDAETMGGVLAVDDDEVEAQAFPQVGNVVQDRLAAGFADHVAAKQYLHGRPIPPVRPRPR